MPYEPQIANNFIRKFIWSAMHTKSCQTMAIDCTIYLHKFFFNFVPVTSLLCSCTSPSFYIVELNNWTFLNSDSL